MNEFDYDPAGEEQFDIYPDVDQAYEDRYTLEEDFDYEESWDDDWFDDSMDGDHASALASAGWGTDEDYGYFGDDY